MVLLYYKNNILWLENAKLDTWWEKEDIHILKSFLQDHEILKWIDMKSNNFADSYN